MSNREREGGRKRLRKRWAWALQWDEGTEGELSPGMTPATALLVGLHRPPLGLLILQLIFGHNIEPLENKHGLTSSPDVGRGGRG